MVYIQDNATPHTTDAEIKNSLELDCPACRPHFNPEYHVFDEVDWKKGQLPLPHHLAEMKRPA